MRLDHLLSRDSAQPLEADGASRFRGEGPAPVPRGRAAYLTKCRASPYAANNGNAGRRGASGDARSRRRRVSRAFQQGRQKKHTEDASALRADEGRGNAAKSVGEPRAGCEPTISEWGNPSVATDTAGRRRAPGELKHLSTPRKRKHPRSSGERTGVSPNHDRGKEAAVAVVGLEGETRGGCPPPPRA